MMILNDYWEGAEEKFAVYFMTILQNFALETEENQESSQHTLLLRIKI
jgi:hypothetical protein